MSKQSEPQSLSLSEIEAMTPEQALATFTAAERELFDAFEELETKHFESDLLQWREKGLVLEKAYKASVSGGSHAEYGKHLIERMAVACDYRSRFNIDAAIRVAEFWSNKQRFMTEIVTRRNGQFHLSWSHLVLLSAVADDRKRESLIDHVFRKRLSAERLGEHMRDKKLRGRSNNPYGVGVYTSVIDCLSDIRGKANILSRVAGDRWTSKDYDVVKEFDKLLPERTPEVVTDIEHTVGAIDTAIEYLTKTRKVVEKVRDKATKRLALQDPSTVEGTVPAKGKATDECLRGGQHEPVQDEDGTYCAKCKDTLDGPAKATPAKKKRKKK
jgi:hypothetical protein